VASLVYDAMHPNAVARADDLEYQYDAAGRMTRRGLTSLGYDYQGRLQTVTGEGGEQTGRFFYGSGMNRVARIENGSVTYYIGNDATVRDGIVTVHPRVGSLRAARVRTASIQADVLTDTAPLAAGDGEINAADAWVSLATTAGIVDGLPDASDAMWLLSGAARRLLTLDGGEKAFLHQDHLGSTTLSTGTDGQVLGETLFYPTGEVRHHSGYVDEYGFSSQELDESTGLLAYSYRQLDPGIGRWTSPDPLFDGLSASSTARLGESTTGYAYVANRYGNATDPTGLAAWFAGWGMGIGRSRSRGAGSPRGCQPTRRTRP
jgi:RHS repeat-associated protein